VKVANNIVVWPARFKKEKEQPLQSRTALTPAYYNTTIDLQATIQALPLPRVKCDMNNSHQTQHESPINGASPQKSVLIAQN
jgi:hypothetical protein